MELTLVCDCGAKRVWKADTFSEIRAAVEKDGWSITIPACPAHEGSSA